MTRRKITAFYAWQSDRPSNVGRHFIRKALDDAARRLSEDPALEVEVVIDADTEGIVGTPPVTETILKKICAADIFVPDLTFVAKTDAGKLLPNPNVMAEYGYALHALTFEAMMPIMNTHFGPPTELPFDLGHVRHPTQYDVAPSVTDGERHAARDRLSKTLEGILRLMVQRVMSKARTDEKFVPTVPVRSPAFFFEAEQVLANFGDPGEQELRFKRDSVIYLRLYPTYADQPRVGLTRSIEVVQKLAPFERVVSPLGTQNDWGAINLQPHGNGITSFTQMFATGELWGVSEKPFAHRDNRELLYAIEVEKAFVATLKSYRTVYEHDLRLRPPFTVEFGATGLKDRYLVVPSQEFPFGDYAGPFRADSISRQYQLTSFDDAEWQLALKDFLVELYDAAARDRSKVLTDAVIADHKLPPR